MIVNLRPTTPPAPPLAYTDPVLDPGVQTNYAALRLERGQTWADMAEQFTREQQPQLAAWASANGRAEMTNRGQVAPTGRTAPAADQHTATPAPGKHPRR